MSSSFFLCVVDDTADYRVLLQSLLQQGCPDCDLSLFAHGQDFLNAISRFERLPDLILLDYHMPDLDGCQTLQMLKQQPVYQSIPVVLMSMQATDEDIRTCYKAGANAFLRKSVDFELFKEQLEATCHYWLQLNQQPARRPDN